MPRAAAPAFALERPAWPAAAAAAGG